MVRSKLLPAVAGLAALWGLVGPAQATDGMSVFPDASRIASIGGAVTEIVYALGEDKRLVARELINQSRLALSSVGGEV